MGMYTEIYITAPVRADAPAEVIAALRSMFDPDWGDFDAPAIEHPFFNAPRRRRIGSCSSYCFVPYATSRMHYSEISKQWYVTSRSDLKNYDGEIEHFFDWVTPYLDVTVGLFFGYSRYEEHLAPTLYFMGANGKPVPLVTETPAVKEI